jgi:hypothetical protein
MADDVERVQERREAELLAVPGVVGLGIARRAGRPVLLVMVGERTPEVARLPATLDGVPLAVEEVGDVAAG